MVVYFGGNDANGDTLGSTYSTNFTSVGCDDGYATIYCPAVNRVVCQPCSKGRFAVAGNYACTFCDSGKYSSTTSSSSCDLCGAGKYGDGNIEASDSSHCLSCVQGKSSNLPGAPSESSCASCSAGKYSGVGSSSCSTCSAGKYSGNEAAVCSGCSPGTYSEAEASKCEDCLPGKFSAANEQPSCGICLAGTYSGVAATTCVDCDVGKYSSSNSAPSCDLCGDGKYQENKGQNGCVSCGLGKASGSVGASSSSVCTDCSPGHYADGLGMSACKPCEPGQFEPSTGSHGCPKCGYSTYSTVVGATSSSTCEFCPLGRFTINQGSGRPELCLSCPAGKRSANVLGEGCKSCERGKYTSTEEMARGFSCELCGRNSFSGSVGSTSCKKCAQGKFSHLGYSECIDCGTNFSSSKATEVYSGSLQGFFLADEEMIGWDGIDEDSGTHSWLRGRSGPLGGANSDVLLALPSKVFVPSMTVTLNFERMMPLVLRGFGKVDSGARAELALSISTDDGATFQEVLVVDLDPALTGWQFVEETFFPHPWHISKQGKVELRHLDGPGSVEWAGIGLYNKPGMSCTCEDGFFMNLDTPNCRYDEDCDSRVKG